MAERAVDLPVFAVALGRALHRAGLPVTPERSTRFARAVALTRPRRADQLYWAARVTFVSRPDQLDTFDRVFAGLFEDRVDVAARRGDPSSSPVRARPRRGEAAPAPPGAPGPAGAALPLGAWAGGDPAGDGAAPREAVLAAASARERLGEKRFEALEPEELAEVQRLMRRLAVVTPRRRSRRARRGRRGERLDVRATIRRSLRTGGDPVHHARRRRRRRPRRLVVICDVSGSMEPYARAILQFLSGAARGEARGEAFVFATRLTRVTQALRGHDPDTAIARAAAAAPDWSGGTRIGEALKAFNDRHGRRGLARGAVVVIVSDGWERGDPDLLAREMERLGRLARRIVWVNPRVAAPGFAPLAGGMAAAIPHCDAVVSGHSLSALDAVVDAIAAPTSERT